MIENDFYLFFHCTLPRQVWLTANPSINTENLAPEFDGVQSTVALIITDNTPEPLLCKLLYTLWFIWKARNDYHFNRKDWTPPQVHHAVQAYMTYNEHNPPQSSTQFAQPPSNHLSVLQAPIQEAPTHFCPYPASLQGSRCYVDVAVVPDNQNINTNNAGLGIFILNFQVQPLQAIYVKAQLHNCQFVLMAKRQPSLLEQLLSKPSKYNHATFSQIPNSWCTSFIRSNNRTRLSGGSNLLGRFTPTLQPIFKPSSLRSTELKT